jgi:phage gp36-like protein
MRYIDFAKLLKAVPLRTLIQLSQDDKKLDEVDMANIEDAVNGAEEIVDSKVSTRYKVPFEEVPTSIADIVVALARYSLYTRRPEGKELPEAVVSSRKTAMALLNEIQMGTFTLNIQATAEAQPETNRMEVATRLPMFGATRLDQY